VTDAVQRIDLLSMTPQAARHALAAFFERVD
jgi:DNA-nicking Smr family endonuclease